MSNPHPLNQAVISQALHDLRNGQLRRCQAMGFNGKELDALKNPSLTSVLANSPVSWCSVRVNRDVVQHLLRQVDDISAQIATVDRMLRLGASSEMVSKFYGLDHQEVAFRRDMLGLPKRRGRYPALSEAQDTELWQRCKPAMVEQNISLGDEKAWLHLAIELAEDLQLPLSVIWSTVHDWIDQGLF